MASRISQMRNGQQMSQQQQLNESIERTRAMMKQLKTMNNKEAAIMQLLQQNPQLGQITKMIRNNQSLESIAQTMANATGTDLNNLISQLNV